MPQAELTPAQRWEILKDKMRLEISSIDDDTPWGETEPKWWLEMMEVDRLLTKPKKNGK